MIDKYGAEVPYIRNGKACWGHALFSNTEPFYGAVALGNKTMFKFGMFWVDNKPITLFVAIEGHGAYTFRNPVQSGYVQGKLNLLREDAGNVADFINAQLGHSDKFKPQGFYMSPYLREQMA